MMFVTVFAGVLDLRSGRLAYLSAGHDTPFVLDNGAEPRQLTGAGGPPLGAVDDFPYPVEHQQLSPGNLLLLYTDGVTEAEDVNHSFYSAARLRQILASAPMSDAKGLVDLVREDVRRFVGDAEQTDDIALLAIRWLGGDS
jgi:sigma-B regulation protein RsbU (phosphoserine phosphatase)